MRGWMYVKECASAYFCMKMRMYTPVIHARLDGKFEVIVSDRPDCEKRAMFQI
jgi:hypothetical protein